MTTVDMLYKEYFRIAVILTIDNSSARFFVKHTIPFYPMDVIYDYSHILYHIFLLLSIGFFVFFGKNIKNPLLRPVMAVKRMCFIHFQHHSDVLYSFQYHQYEQNLADLRTFQQDNPYIS